MSYRYKRQATGKGYYTYRDTKTGKFTSKDMWTAEREAEWTELPYGDIEDIEYPEKG